jgi:hypothetical protein
MSRFFKVTENDINELLQENHSKNTKNVVSNAQQKLFEEFCKSEKSANLRQVTSDKLNDVLQRFWPAVRTQKSQFFKKNSFKSLRYGLKSYLKQELKLTLIKIQSFKHQMKFIKQCW